MTSRQISTKGENDIRASSYRIYGVYKHMFMGQCVSKWALGHVGNGLDEHMMHEY